MQGESVRLAKERLSGAALELMRILASPEGPSPLASKNKTTNVHTLRKKSQTLSGAFDEALQLLYKEGYIQFKKANRDVIYLTGNGLALVAGIRENPETREFLFEVPQPELRAPPEKMAIEYEGASLLVWDELDENRFAVRLLYKCRNRECDAYIEKDFVWEEAIQWEPLTLACLKCDREHPMYYGQIR